MSLDVLEDLQRAIKHYDKEIAVSSAKYAIEGGIEPNDIFKAMAEAIREVGDSFGKGDIWLPELMAASDTLLKATPIVEEALKNSGGHRKGLGKVVIGTVHGDIHNAGKNMVALLLIAEGFVVHDLGVDVDADEFVRATKEHKADILCMSALMTTTITGMKDVIELLKKEGIRNEVKIMVGGAAVNQAYANSIGADGYDPTAPGGAKLAVNFLRR